jgi:hypothetical protein
MPSFPVAFEILTPFGTISPPLSKKRNIAKLIYPLSFCESYNNLNLYKGDMANIQYLIHLF